MPDKQPSLADSICGLILLALAFAAFYGLVWVLCNFQERIVALEAFHG